MANPVRKSIAVISMARNDSFFITKWIDYYSKHLGSENLFLILDGSDQPLPNEFGAINVIRVPHLNMPRAKGDRNRSRMVSHFAKALFHRFDIVIAHDIDEFLVVDPNESDLLYEYLQRPILSASLSALGLDVGQHIENEQPIDPTMPFLEQRSFAHVFSRYTKPVVANRPLTWGSGFHRVKGKNFRIDPNLYLVHFGMVDFNISKDKTGDQNLHKAGWKGHFGRRFELFELILNATAIDGDDFFKSARRRQSLCRPIYAINKPGKLHEKPIVRIPIRFRSII